MSSGNLKPVGDPSGDDPRIQPEAPEIEKKSKDIKGKMPPGRSVGKKGDHAHKTKPSTKKTPGCPLKARGIKASKPKEDVETPEAILLEGVSLVDRTAEDKTIEGKKAFKRALFDTLCMAQVAGIVLIQTVGRVLINGEEAKKNIPEAVGMIAGNMAHALSRVIVYGFTKGIDKAVGTTLTEKAYNSGLGDIIAAIPQKTFEAALQGGTGVIVALIDVAQPLADPLLAGVREAVKSLGEHLNEKQKAKITEIIYGPLGKLETLTDQKLEKLKETWFASKEAIEKQEEKTQEIEAQDEENSTSVNTAEKPKAGIIAGTTPPEIPEISPESVLTTEKEVSKEIISATKASTTQARNPIVLTSRRSTLPVLRAAKNTFLEAFFSALEMLGLGLRIIIGATGKFLLSGGKTGDELVASAEIAFGNLANALTQTLVFAVTSVADVASFGQMGFSEKAKSSGFADLLGSIPQTIFEEAATLSTRIIVVVLDPALKNMGPLIAQLSKLALSAGNLLPEKTTLYLKGLPADTEEWLEERLGKLKLALLDRLDNKGDLKEEIQDEPPDAT